MLSGGKPTFPTCEFSYLDRCSGRWSGFQQNKAELIGLYAIAPSGLKDKCKLPVKKTSSYSFASQKNASDKDPISTTIYHLPSRQLFIFLSLFEKAYNFPEDARLLKSCRR